MNRQTRRRLAAHADALSVLLARSCLGYGRCVRPVLVQDARAVRALESAFARMLRGGGEPLVVEVTQEVAAAFPLQRGGDAILSRLAKAWLAVGIDREGRATYAMRRLCIAGVSPSEERDLAEVAMLGELAKELNAPGFPVGSSMGRA